MNGQPVKKKKRRKWPWILAVVLLASAGAAAMSLTGGGRSPMTGVAAQRRDIVTYYSFSGYLTPVSDQVQTAKQTMKVKELYVNEGDVVQKGDALLRATDGKRVYASCGGTVEEWYAEEEDQLQPGSKLARIVDYADLEVSVDVDEYDISAIDLGKEGTVYLNALDRQAPGVVSEVARSATSSGGVSYFQVKMRIAAQEDVRSGMSVEVSILNQQALNAVSLPLDALSYDEYNKPYVFLKDAKEELTARYVETGVSDGQNIEILSGLNDGQEVFYRRDDMARFFAMRESMMNRGPGL